MSSPPAVLQNSLGRTVRIGREIGKGGEGAVYEAKDQNDLAIKVYWSNKAADRRDKIGAMVAAAWFKSTPFVAFPIDVLYSPNGSFAGFLMRRIGGHKPLHLLYSPSSRKLEFTRTNFRFLIRSGLNTARAVASVHATDCVIGDVNHSGFLVSDKATITLIDSDSFQVVALGKNFLCQVATPEYTPPELQSSRFDRVKRTRNHDNFGLAVLLFQLLFMGRHPFSGRFLGRGDMPLERAISEFRFAYSSNKAATSMEPPPNVPLLSDFPEYISVGFEKAFGREGVQDRLKAETWVSLLERLETELQQCPSNSAHHHVKGKPCPWCRMEQANPGFIAFTSNQPIRILPINVDTTQVVVLINSIKDPGTPPGINSVVQAPANLVASGPSSAIIASLRKQYGAGIGASIVGFLLLTAGVPTLPCLLIGAAGAAFTFYPHAHAKKIADAKRQAEAGWRAAADAWSRQAGNKRFLEIKREAENFIRDLNALPAEERCSLQQLEQKKRDVQLRHFLERFQLRAAKIRKIGSGRKAFLASFGIETAADIEQQRLTGIQGFGPALIFELISWRKNLEQKFVFNASEPISPADIAAVKATVANKKASLEGRLRASVTSLQQAANIASDQRRSLIASANAAFARLKQAEAEERLVHPIFIRVAKIVSASCLILTILNLGSTQNVVTPPPPTIQTTTVPKIVPQPPLQRKSDASSNSQALAPRLPSPPFMPPPMPGKQESAVIVPAPPLPPPVQIPSPSSPDIEQIQPQPPADDLPKLDIARPSDVTQIQQRLAELGYLSTSPDGRWGPRSGRALQDFRSANHIPGEAAWDRQTEERLFSADAIRAIALTFEGGWTLEPGQCGAPGTAPPLRITTARAETDAGRCNFGSVRIESEGTWRVAARCAVGDDTWPANIQLMVSGNRLTWTSEKGTTEYYRCPIGARRQ
jgi:DNA-binding helix-hairpin-helix protein with protein kinase domain/peptidoglycan hydrolase-like protein with peptidoglycan-binding domain